MGNRTLGLIQLRVLLLTPCSPDSRALSPSTGLPFQLPSAATHPEGLRNMADGNLPSSVGLFWLQAVCGARSCPEAAAREQAADTPHLQVELVRKHHGSQPTENARAGPPDAQPVPGSQNQVGCLAPAILPALGATFCPF